MEGVRTEVWDGVSRAARVAGVSAEEFAERALVDAAEAALAERSIYCLCDPRTDEIRYVGQSVDPANRLKGHKSDRDGTAKSAWVAELRSEGLEPTLVVLSTVPAAEAAMAEQWFIEGYRRGGHPLLNAQKAYELPEVVLRLFPPTYEWVRE
jgi:hypothetical protein